MEHLSNVGQVKAFFDRPEKYLHKRFGIRFRKRLLGQLLGESSFDKVIDIGCGDGSLSVDFAHHAKSLVLVDISGAMLKLAFKNLESSGANLDRAAFREGNFLKMEFHDHFDLVLLIGVLAHVPSVTETIAKASDIMHSGSRLVIQFSDAGSLPLKLKRMFGRPKKDYRLNETSLNKVVQLLNKNGLEIIAKKRYMFRFPGMKFFPDACLFKLQVLAAGSPLFKAFTSDYLVVAQKKEIA